MSESKGNGPSLREIAGQFISSASDAAVPVVGNIADSALIAAGSVFEAVDVEGLTQEIDKAKAEVLSAAGVAGFALVGKAASHPIVGKAVTTVLTAKQSGGKHEAGSADNSLLDIGINLVIDKVGRKLFGG